LLVQQQGKAVSLVAVMAMIAPQAQVQAQDDQYADRAGCGVSRAPMSPLPFPVPSILHAAKCARVLTFGQRQSAFGPRN
jgi:hypothetical protein